MNKRKILLVEDDKNIITNLTEFLQSEGFSVTTVHGQRDALQRIDNESFDLILLDVSLEDGNGYAVCAAVKMKCDTPIIFVTASGDEYSIIAGLDMGADDYIAKPFRPRELLSRIRSVLRRSGKAQSVLELEGLRVDTVKGIVTKDNKEIYLSALEYRLLLVFLNNRGITLSRSKLLEEIWDIAGDFVNDNTLTVYIKRLREKIEDNPQNPIIIKTVHILKNCMEHMQTSGIINVKVSENAIYTEIVIKDNGKGIDKDDLPHLFERFYKGKNSDDKSIGIGLALSRAIITAQDGTIKAENNNDGGAKFTIRFYKSTV